MGRIYTTEKHQGEDTKPGYFLGIHKGNKASGKSHSGAIPAVDFLANPHLCWALWGDPHPLCLAAPWHPPHCLSCSDWMPQARKILLREEVQEKYKLKNSGFHKVENLLCSGLCFGGCYPPKPSSPKPSFLRKSLKNPSWVQTQEPNRVPVEPTGSTTPFVKSEEKSAKQEQLICKTKRFQVRGQRKGSLSEESVCFSLLRKKTQKGREERKGNLKEFRGGWNIS